jgi:hypothetical protein
MARKRIFDDIFLSFWQAPFIAMNRRSIWFRLRASLGDRGLAVILRLELHYVR